MFTELESKAEVKGLKFENHESEDSQETARSSSTKSDSASDRSDSYGRKFQDRVKSKKGLRGHNEMLNKSIMHSLLREKSMFQ